MPGRPELNNLENLIRERGGDEWVFDQLAERSVGKVAADFGYSRKLLYDWRDRSEQRKAGWTQAMKMRAHVQVEKGEAVFDELAANPNATSVDVQKARELGNWYLRHAEKLNPEEYGEQKPSVNVSIGELHLTALRAAMPTLTKLEGQTLTAHVEHTTLSLPKANEHQDTQDTEEGE